MNIEETLKVDMIYRTMTRMTWRRLLLLAVILTVQCSMFNVFAQIKIGGNVYGGGNKGNVDGSTRVTVLAGDIGAVDKDATRPLEDPKGRVFGGARMANVGGNTFVHIDGESELEGDLAAKSNYIVVNQVFGGNDIAGQIGTAAAVGEAMPTELTAVKRNSEDAENKKKNAVDNTFNSYVRISTKLSNQYYTPEEIDAAASDEEADAYGKTTADMKPAAGARKVYIGQLFAGGNGDFDYVQSEPIAGKVTHTIYNKSDKNHTTPLAQLVTDAGEEGFRLPELDKTYLEVVGGSIVYAYGGGNNATVKEKTLIHIDNPSAVVNHIYVDDKGEESTTATETSHTGYTDLLSTQRFEEMGINTTYSRPSSGAYQVGRFFGGNNLAEMHIRPTWNFLAGKVRNLYSGGNRGDMTSPEGLLLEIPDYSTLIVDNVYGGCRMANVEPKDNNGIYKPTSNLPGYNFPDELSARVLIRGGNINNVYGGNDVTGTVFGGNAIGIHTSVRGDVYGGGNGAYPYTDVQDYGDFSDFFYGRETDIDDLNNFRPNAEQVSIRLMGKDPNNFTIIKGSVYLGGNCATLDTKKSNPLVELKMGSYVIADKVFLGNNGTTMVAPDILRLYADANSEVGYFSSLDLTNSNTFEKYMEGVAMDLQPKIVFDADYVDNSSYIGSFYCGGNVGSMAIPGKNTYKIDRRLNIFEKFVGGCNNANVLADTYNAAYEGGVLGAVDERPDFLDSGGRPKDRLQIDFENLTITPLRWEDDSKTKLIWNTNKWDDNQKKFVTVANDAVDKDTRLLGGNLYGGCYNSGHVNGNVIININEDVLKKDEVFGTGTGSNGRQKSGVEFEYQRDDVMAVALSMFGAGYGENTEIWGSTTVNLNNGYAFQVYGGGEKGVVGKKKPKYDTGSGQLIGQEYVYNPVYSCTVNLNGSQPIYSSDAAGEDLAETEFIYGGGNEGDVCGNTYVNLGNGRIYDAFGGASDADILGHAEVYIGRQPNGNGGYADGFPWVRDIVYGGNDFGGIIHGEYEDGFDFTSRIRNYAADGGSLHGTPTNANPGLLKSASYVEYLQGRVDTIFGGNYGYYNYALKMYEGSEMPYLHNSFVNIRPNTNGRNAIKGVFGGGTGYPANRDGDKSQNQSYVLIDIPDGVDKYEDVDVFGSGSYNGLGMRYDKDLTKTSDFNRDSLSAIVDLMHGKIRAVYGGSFNEGITVRTVVNVPEVSTIKVNDIFGGAFGTQILPPCDVYESNVNYRNTNEEALVSKIYGGNNKERRTLYAKVNISSPVWSNKEKGYLATVFGAGKGIDTWSEYTEVNLLNGARIYEVYGGGEMGHVLNAESVQKYMQLYKDGPSPQIGAQDPYWKTHKDDLSSTDADVKERAKTRWATDWADAWTLGDYYKPTANFNTYVTNSWTNLTNTALVTHNADMDDRDFTGYADADKARVFKKYNANVRIHEGATVVNYAYGGGLGADDLDRSGDVYGTTYIALLGGTVQKDIYAAGTTGAVYDLFGVGAYNTSNPTGFTASANAYVKGGSCRNVYGGGWKGDVGFHNGEISDSPDTDILGETHVVIGDVNGSSFTNGLPTVQRNAYGGGEGGAVFGTAHLTMYNGYVGYLYDGSNYVEKLEDDTKASPNTLLKDAGCLFGGGYIDNSTVDKTRVSLYDGHVRGSVFGGGEIAAIGRGSISKTTIDGKTQYSLNGLYRPGKTNIEIFGGHVYRNVFGGGRGTDNLGGHGSLNCDGYIFGQTVVHIHGGEIGSVSAVAEGNGNVYGGGDEGFVYSALEENGTFFKGVKIGERYGSDAHQGYYFKHTWADSGEGSGFSEVDGENIFTEDCKVLVEPHLKVTTAVTINGHSYTPGQYVPIEDLNTLGNKTADEAKWSCLDPTGIIIHNAVFAGGNTPSGSLSTNANTASVFGNATASVNDIFHRDMITLGTRHTGGLYGDGNLTLVDGYRELNITNYGTDYYSIPKSISIADYHDLPDREADYYELKYTCLKDCQDKEGTQYRAKNTEEGVNASTITADEMQNLFVKDVTDGQGNIVMENGKPKKESVKDGSTDILVYDSETGEWVPNPNGGSPYWEESGVLPVYAGRLMNSIQRSDFCGVWGSRMVMQGAQDRVPEEVDYTNYTINRVREVSLNKKTVGGVDHGNYFGIYNIVNYLGALTSDVDFGDDTNRPYARTTDNTSDNTKYKCAANGQAYNTASFYDWKKEFSKDRKRNNGNSHNKVALASGVYLELTTEKSTGNGLYEKDWGPITGVIELDLINVSTGIGGGFVYAKNQHGVRTKSNHKNTTLTALNSGAVTQWDYNYSPTENDDNQKEFETSGNFVHSTQTIIDDCYNVSNRYMGEGKMPAHYWYIKGSVYVYDQYISAYTGVPNAYSESVDIPLTIAAASHGKMKLLDIMPNRYAYYASPGVKLEDNKKLVINDKTYYKNDPISYWDWYLLSKSEKDLFVEKTFVNCITCKIDGTEYEAGTYVMTDAEFEAYKNSSHTYTNAEGEAILDADKNAADADYIFRSSNIVGHDTGYILTYELNNPSQWDNWYTLRNGNYRDKKTLAEYGAMDVSTKANYYDGPTYRLKSDYTDGMLLGQRSYKYGEVIAKSVVDTYGTIPSAAIPTDEDHKQAIFEKAFVVTTKITVTEDNAERHYNPGSTVPKSFAEAHGITEEAYICTKTIQVTKEDVIYKDSKMKKSEVNAYISDVNGKMEALKSGASAMTTEAIKALETTTDFTAESKKALTELAVVRDELNTNLVEAYYCKKGGLYGGNYFEANKNYRGLEAWSSLTAADHAMFDYNYDALDVLIDPNYSGREGQKYQYDGNYTSEEAVRDATTGNKAGYSVPQSVDYTASYYGSNEDKTESGTEKKYMEVATSIVSSGKVYVGDELDRDVYEALPNEQRHYAPIAVKAGTTNYYVVNTAFQIGSTPYAAGETISGESFNGLPSSEQANITTLSFVHTPTEDQTVYYCREAYTPSGQTTTVPSSVISGAGTGAAGSLGTIINSGQYAALPNQQRNFTIHGISPTETSTLYVSRESDIYDLSKEKIITVIYEYDYDETDGQGNVTPISERHVVNIHLMFKSGVPIVEDISAPDIILPGDYTSIYEPDVTPGAYEVTGGGWELFETQRDAESHSNGVDYNPNDDPLYWYQDGYYVAYYAKSYAGRTYSNYVPISVANYHDLANVMSDENKSHHMYIDNKNVKRAPKIYINDYSGSGKNGLDLFKNLYDLSLLTTEASSGDLQGHALLNDRVKGGKNLEFFLRTDLSRNDDPAVANEWTSIASGSDPCFQGTLHGDGHTISGLDNSLFGHLCGSVYNLGVTGSFNTAGVADDGDGYVESCWVKTTGGTPLETKPYPVFGAPSDGTGYQVVNSYFWDGNKSLYQDVAEGSDVTYSNGSKGAVRAMTAEEFYNGTVAYDLNNFYLYKRYSDQKVTSGPEAEKYSYFTIGDDGKLELQNNHYYTANAGLCSTGHEDESQNVIMYVEDRIADGDFRYADGTIPETEDERYYTWSVTDPDTGKEIVESAFFPIWPDDYIFFGQKLTYDWAVEAHQDVPTAVVRDGGRLSLDDDANRVYRAPAYYRNNTMGVVHFNPKAYLAAKEKLTDEQKENHVVPRDAYPGMTAIDFAGHADATIALGKSDKWFYPPLLDDDGLTGITNCDETRNLLVYAPAETSKNGYANKKTYDVLNAYFTEPAFNTYYDNSDGYRLVGDATNENSSIFGHLVQSNLTATNDHLLVDKEDFYAPFGYTFGSDARMWYQRIPGNQEYVDRKKGWQGISLPFTAEFVTTHQKGEITHFYSGSEASKNGTGTKIGHEYWLREFTGVKSESEVAKAVFTYPSAPETGDTKTVTNTFLWNYYYKGDAGGHNQKDANDDTYQEYYRRSRSYEKYAFLASGTPYLLGLPGATYYEFDLSGSFEAQNTATAVGKLKKQVITFASETGATINDSYSELNGVKPQGSALAFKPNYLNESLAAGTSNYVLEAEYDSDNDGKTDCSRFGKVPDEGDATMVYAFRPFFTSGNGNTRSILFDEEESELKGDEDHGNLLEGIGGTLNIFAKKNKIYVESSLNFTEDLRVVTPAGITVATFTVKPGQTVEVEADFSGMYVVHTLDGLYVKKVSVKK